MADGRKNNGGARKGAGRPRKAKEEHIKRLGIEAIEKVYGSVSDYYYHIAKQSKESFPHLKLLQEYVYGKAPDVVVFGDEEKEEQLDYSQLSEQALKEIIGLNKIKDRPEQGES